MTDLDDCLKNKIQKIPRFKFQKRERGGGSRVSIIMETQNISQKP